MRELIQREIDAVNAKMPQVQQVRKFHLLTKELDHDDGEVTATMKVRRKSIAEKYATGDRGDLCLRRLANAGGPRLERLVEPGIALLRCDRPQRLNALTDATVAEIGRLLDAVGADPALRVLIVTGAGRGFCAGFDLGVAAPRRAGRARRNRRVDAAPGSVRVARDAVARRCASRSSRRSTARPTAPASASRSPPRSASPAARPRFNAAFVQGRHVELRHRRQLAAAALRRHCRARSTSC